MSPFWPLHAFVSRWRGPKVRRSPAWPALERRFKSAHPTCAGCGGRRALQVHHHYPVHLYPQLELDEKNLIALCMGPRLCHLKIGHRGNWKDWNADVVADAAAALALSRSLA